LLVRHTGFGLTQQMRNGIILPSYRCCIWSAGSSAREPTAMNHLPHQRMLASDAKGGVGLP
jgi:hypothetical protein